MASSKIFQTTQISFSIMLLTLFFILLLHKVNSTETTYFSITKFVSDQKNIIFQGDGSSTGRKLQLTDASPFALGRALYSTPIHIWDSETGKVGNFETNFTFLINAPNIYRISDGLAFFLAPVDTQPQTGGGYLGLFNDGYYKKSYQTVAVEFDTYYNYEWDQINGKHIGIDVNWIRSIKTTPWGFRNGEEANVVIKFNGDTKLLSVTLTYDDNVSYRVSGYVDLKDVLPEWVRVGFSASTGSFYSAEHSILSWYFTSELTYGDSTSMQLQAKLPYTFAI